MESRRKFLKTAAASTLLLTSIEPLNLFTGQNSQGLADANTVSNPIPYKAQKGGFETDSRIKPRGLEKGNKIAIVSPASPVSMWNLSAGIRVFERLGLDVEVGEIAKNQKNAHRYFAAPDEERAAEFMEYIQRDDISAIICARGGYGVMRILRQLNYDIIRQNPKIIMGFSDITALLHAIYAQTGIVTYHGPVASNTFDNFTVSNMSSILYTQEANFDLKVPELRVINKGYAEGILQAGNLRLICNTLGTPYEINTKDAILFLEDVSEHAYEIDRMLTQLMLAGKFDTCKAVVFGKFKNLNTRKSFYPNRSMTILEVINDFFKDANVPCFLDFPFGHTASKTTLPIGIYCSIDSETKSFKLLENPVA